MIRQASNCGPQAPTTFSIPRTIRSYSLASYGYTSGLSASYRITDGPLQPGRYRYRINTSVEDRFGNSLAEPYLRSFEVLPLAPYVIENRSNDSPGNRDAAGSNNAAR
jgi:hypothetical protein